MSSVAAGVAIVPDLHVDVDALVQWVVVIEALVRRLHRLHRPLYLSALHVIDLSGNTALFKLSSHVGTLIFCLNANDTLPGTYDKPVFALLGPAVLDSFSRIQPRIFSFLQFEGSPAVGTHRLLHDVEHCCITKIKGKSQGLSELEIKGQTLGFVLTEWSNLPS